jgi:hypothetical protein
MGARGYQITLREATINANANTTAKLYRNLDVASLLAGSAGTPSFSLAAGGTGQTIEHPVWKPNYRGKSFAMRLDFNLAPKSLVVDGVEMTGEARSGFRY